MEAKAMEAKAMEDKAVEVKAMEAKAMEAKAMGAKAMEEKVMEWKAKAMGAAALMATMVTAMAAAATTCFSSGPHDGRGCTTGCNRLLVGCVSGCTPRRRAGVRVRWRSSSVRCGRQSTSRSRRANLGGRARWSRREEDRFHCATFEADPFFCVSVCPCVRVSSLSSQIWERDAVGALLLRTTVPR